MTLRVIRDVEVNGVGGLDIRLVDGVIAEMGRSLDTTGATVVEGNGGAVVPGLTDHHLHLHAAAAAFTSVRCGPPGVETSTDLASVLASAPADAAGWVRGVGYDERTAGLLDAAGLDRLHSYRPVRIQHRSGALWILNSAAVDASRLATGDHPGVERSADGSPTGRVWRADEWLRGRLPVLPAPSLEPIGRALARFGVTSVTDATPDMTLSSRTAVRRAMSAGQLPQRVHLLGLPLVPNPLGSETVEGRLTCGPYKIVIADSDLPDVESLERTIRRAHSLERAVAVHCVSVEALVLLLHAFDEIGTLDGDRIEHASLIPAECIDRIRGLGLRVVTQPGFLSHRGDSFLAEVAEQETHDLYRCASLLHASIPVALSSDAPYGPLDPWSIIASAIHRLSESGVAVVPSERISSSDALDAFLTPAHDPGGEPRRVTAGAPADLVLLDAPLAEVLRDPGADAVRATYIDGEPV